ncbi:MAG: hypothetical protein GF315_14230, partial [candidate division Zixibacteria bacterium]|nr:hypothetical protein [candidate division Zixibacteria bacterium]
MKKYLFLFILILSGSGFTEASASDLTMPNREYEKGDTVFFGDGSWYIKAPYEIPWDSAEPPETENTAGHRIVWSEPMRLTYFEGDVWRPKAVVEDSIIHVIFMYDPPGIGDIYYLNSLDSGDNWSELLILSQSEWYVEKPSIEMHEANTIAAWTFNSGPEIHCSNSFDYGNTWEFLDYYERHTSSPVFAYLDNNSVLMCFYKGETEGRWIDRSTDWGNSWEGEIHLSDMGLGGRIPNMVSQGSYVHIGYNQKWNTQSTEIHYHHSPDYGQSWDIDNLLTEDDGIPSQWASTSVHDSVVHIAWDDMKYGGTEVMTIRSTDNGITWGEETRLSFSH